MLETYLKGHLARINTYLVKIDSKGQGLIKLIKWGMASKIVLETQGINTDKFRENCQKPVGVSTCTQQSILLSIALSTH